MSKDNIEMPYEINKISPRRYMLRNALTGQVHSYCTTLKNAEKQVRLMHMLDAQKQHTKQDRKRIRRKTI